MSVPVQGVLPALYKIQTSELINSEWEQTREPNPSKKKIKSCFPCIFPLQTLEYKSDTNWYGMGFMLLEATLSFYV
jgi:hypothetical protein